MNSFTKVTLLIVLALAVSITAVCAAESTSTNVVDPAQDADPLAGLKPGHPRLLLSDADWKALRERQTSDPGLARVTARIEADAKSLLNDPPLVYKKEGKCLLDISRQAVQHILLWSVAYHPADPPKDDFNAANPGTRILIVNVTAPASGHIELDVALRPGSTEP